jgi:hypothetical protein
MLVRYYQLIDGFYMNVLKIMYDKQYRDTR